MNSVLLKSKCAASKPFLSLAGNFPQYFVLPCLEQSLWIGLKCCLQRCGVTGTAHHHKWNNHLSLQQQCVHGVAEIFFSELFKWCLMQIKLLFALHFAPLLWWKRQVKEDQCLCYVDIA